MKLEPTDDVRRALQGLEDTGMLTAYTAWALIAPMALEAAAMVAVEYGADDVAHDIRALKP